MMESHFQQNDRELLVRLDEKLAALLAKIEGMSERLASLESSKASITVQQDHELRIRRLEVWGSLAIGGLAVLEFILNKYGQNLFK